jgi:DNA-binding LacI/PurR family transcriptional regulator
MQTIAKIRKGFSKVREYRGSSAPGRAFEPGFPQINCMIKQTTIKDIANDLKVSPATVSRALRNHPNISTKRKKTIIEKAEELNYQPDSIAQSLKSRQTLTIGVIVPEIKHNFFSAVLDGIEEVAYKAGYTILVCKSNEDYEREIINTNALVSKRVAGIIVSVAQNSTNADHFTSLKKRNIPVVFFDRVLEDEGMSKVMVDDYEGAFRLTEHLIGSGYRKIAHLAGLKHLWISNRRMEAYRDALKQHGLPFREDYLIHGGFDEEDGIKGYQTLMRLDEKPDAVFAVNDPVALGVYMSCKKDGLRIPEDMAIAGFSDNPISALLDPPLTTVSQPAYEMGLAAAKMLLEQIRDGVPAKPVTQVCNTQLIVRRST